MREKLAEILTAFCRNDYRSIIEPVDGYRHLIYLEGANIDFTLNSDEPDKWNDLRCVVEHKDGKAFFSYAAIATTEPGIYAARLKRSLKIGGVFRISVGYHHEKWVNGFHKGDKGHPALVQAPGVKIWGYRDRNMDGRRNRGEFTDNVKGLNHHGTRFGVKPATVGLYSLGCLCGYDFTGHLFFMRDYALKDVRFRADPNFRFSTTVVDWSAFWAYLTGVALTIGREEALDWLGLEEARREDVALIKQLDALMVKHGAKGK